MKYTILKKKTIQIYYVYFLAPTILNIYYLNCTLFEWQYISNKMPLFYTEVIRILHNKENYLFTFHCNMQQ